MPWPMPVVALAVSLVMSQASAPDAELAKGIRQVQDGEYDGAIVTLDAVVRRLAPDRGRAKELSQAYLYLGIAYFGMGHVTSAKAKFQEALAQAGDLSLSPQDFSPKVIEAFEQARREPKPTGGGSRGPTTATTPQEKKGGGKGMLVLLGVGGAAAVGIGVAAGGGGGEGTSPAPSAPAPPSNPNLVTQTFTGLLTGAQTAAQIVVGPAQSGGPWRAELNWIGTSTEVRMFVVDAATEAGVGDARLTGPNSSVLEWEGRANLRYRVDLFLQPGGAPSSEYLLKVTHPR